MVTRLSVKHIKIHKTNEPPRIKAPCYCTFIYGLTKYIFPALEYFFLGGGALYQQKVILGLIKFIAEYAPETMRKSNDKRRPGYVLLR